MSQNQNLSYQNDLYLSLLAEYAAGCLPVEQRVIVSAHLSLQPQARGFIRQCESLSAALIQQHCPPVSMTANALEHVLDCIDQKAKQQRCTEEGKCAPWPEDLCSLPHAIEHYLLERLSQARQTLQWHTDRPGIDRFDIPVTCKKSQMGMTKMAPGCDTARREVRYSEITLVLNGGLGNEDEEYYTGALIIREREKPVPVVHACKKSGCVYIRLSGAFE